jgi:hypothetical protein
MLMADFSDCSMWMTEFSVTHMLWACVVLGFCNREHMILTCVPIEGATAENGYQKARALAQ